MWLARLERGMRGDEGQELRKWLADPLNRDTILEAAGLWYSKDVQSLLFALTGMSPQRRRAVAPKRTVLFPLIVALISTAALIWMITGHGPRRPPAAAKTVPAVPTTPYSTAIGETRQVTLADGTRVTLNTNSACVSGFRSGRARCHSTAARRRSMSRMKLARAPST
jgi:transmembrane sensor